MFTNNNGPEFQGLVNFIKLLIHYLNLTNLIVVFIYSISSFDGN